jgi:hypothetical protein
MIDVKVENSGFFRRPEREHRLAARMATVELEMGEEKKG